MEQVDKARPLAIGNYLVTIMFACIGLVEIIGGDYLDAGLWIALGLSVASFGNETTPWREIQLSRKVVGGTFLIIAVALFAIRVAIDFSN